MSKSVERSRKYNYKGMQYIRIPHFSTKNVDNSGQKSVIHREIHKNVDVALVLHGGSGVPDEEIKASINAGIRKINFGTDLCYAFLDQVFATGRDKVGIDLFMKDAVEAVASFAEEKIKLLGADNKA